MRAWNGNRFASKLGIDLPIIQGPLGGLSSQRLTAAVSNFGGLGSFGAHGLPPEAIKDVIAEIRPLTSKPFAMNLWVSIEGARTSDESAFNRRPSSTCDPYRSFGSASSDIQTLFADPRFEDQARVLRDAKVPALSFIYGIGPRELLDECE